jgi:uncharacterized hydrophobic protein (TIGR00341 family)
VSLRLLKVLVAEEDQDEALELLESHGATPRWCTGISGGRVAIDVVIRAAGNEPVLDSLDSRFGDDEGFRLLFFPLEATVPRLPEEDDDDAFDSADPRFQMRKGSKEASSKRIPSRINREELYGEIADLSQSNFYYLSMSALSSVVATAGLLLGDGAVIVGAMVIAPLIGPSMGTAFATTLGDLKLGRNTVLASIYGALVAFAVAFVVGLILTVDPEGSEIFGRTRLTYEHLALALAAGAAGALAITQGKGAGLVGVMVAVALLPPLANAGLLLGDGHMALGIGALALVAGNVVSVNLAATLTFLLLGVRPNTWWEEGIRKRAVWTASALWTLMLLGLAAIVWFAWGGQPPSL